MCYKLLRYGNKIGCQWDVCSVAAKHDQSLRYTTCHAVDPGGGNDLVVGGSFESLQSRQHNTLEERKDFTRQWW